MIAECARAWSLLLLLAAGVWAQDNPPAPPALQASADTSYVTCGEKPVTSRTVRSDIFISPDGKRRAYAEVEATAIRPQRTAGYSGPLCVNNARLFVASDTGDFKLVFLQEPSDTDTGNSLRIVDWSADSRRLLLELAQWQYDSPGVSRSPLVYDANYGVFQQPDMNHVFSKQFGTECLLGVHVLGFSPEGRVAIETQPLSPEEEEVLAVSSCSRKKAVWSLSIVTETLTPLPESSKVQHYGKSEPQPAK